MRIINCRKGIVIGPNAHNVIINGAVFAGNEVSDIESEGEDVVILNSEFIENPTPEQIEMIKGENYRAGQASASKPTKRG